MDSKTRQMLMSVSFGLQKSVKYLRIHDASRAILLHNDANSFSANCIAYEGKSLYLCILFSQNQSQMQLSEQEIVRRESLKRLRELGIDPFPAARFATTASVKQVLEDFKKLEGREVVLAGRIMSRRIMGKASFAELKDGTGRMKIYVNRYELCPG